ncbi:LOW QUALITY PROTEIN: protein YIPF5 [Arvicanthis niloticus]|uniref:LOW QUALITY PROTEIN: protein YIPF5 n=1 Tax=Arvicanthis niloticus TaxID=61156 RepID=UPI001486EAB6|nr:LOW QUALITY PROTEIN: protein YIPF5 [Arvicanthis niloticus]
MSGFDNLNSGFYQTSYSIDEQSQQSYDYGGSGGPYSKQYADYSQQGRFVLQNMMQPQQTYTGQFTSPTQAYPPTTPQSFYGDSFEEEPPLLEELGINFDHIWQKTLTVLQPPEGSRIGSIMNETDLAGGQWVVFCLAFGATLLTGKLLAGKIQFGYVYGISAIGWLGMFFVCKFNEYDRVSTLVVWQSVLGYCLIPHSLLSSFAVVFSLQGMVGILLTATIIGWCSFSASKIFISALAMDGQQLLVAYPCALLYGVFALISVF